MIMKSRLPCIAVVMVVMSALAVTAATRRATTRPTTETSGQSLKGKMFTLSRYGGRISFFPPYYSPTTPWTTRPYYTTTFKPTTRPYYTTTFKPTTRPYYTTTTRPYYTTTQPYYTTTFKPTTRPYYTTTTRPYYTTTFKPTTRPYYTTTFKPTTRPYYTTTTRPYYTTTTRPYDTTTTSWTTAPATRGVSVCLRYLAEDLSSLFTLSPSGRAPLQLSVSSVGSFSLNFGRYQSMYFRPNFRFWSNIGPDIWARVCVTVDSMNNVVQVFSGPNISIRKRLNIPYVWSGEPVIEFPGFDGQLTDVQIWDYPLRYKEVFNYMTSGIYAPYRGSALSWSDISYSPRGQSLLEDTFEWQARQPIGSRVRKGHRAKGGKKTWAFSNMEGQRERL